MEEKNKVEKTQNKINEKEKNNLNLKFIIPIAFILISVPIIYFATTKLINNVETGLEDNSLNKDQIIEKKEKENIKENDSQKEDKEQKNTEPTIEYDDIKLTNENKINYNKSLANQGFDFALRYITDFENKDFIYNKNILDNVNSKFAFTLTSMLEDPNSFKLFVPYEDMSKEDQMNNTKIIEYLKIMEHSKKVLANPLTEEEIKKITIGNSIIENNKIKISLPMGWGLGPFILKANSLKKSTDKTEEILVADVLTKKVNNKIDYDTLMPLYENNILTWNKDLNYAKIEIIYKIVNNEKLLYKITFFKN